MCSQGGSLSLWYWHPLQKDIAGRRPWHLSISRLRGDLQGIVLAIKVWISFRRFVTDSRERASGVVYPAASRSNSITHADCWKWCVTANKHRQIHLWLLVVVIWSWSGHKIYVLCSWSLGTLQRVENCGECGQPPMLLTSDSTWYCPCKASTSWTFSAQLRVQQSRSVLENLLSQIWLQKDPLVFNQALWEARRKFFCLLYALNLL